MGYYHVAISFGAVVIQEVVPVGSHCCGPQEQPLAGFNASILSASSGSITRNEEFPCRRARPPSSGRAPRNDKLLQLARCKNMLRHRNGELVI